MDEKLRTVKVAVVGTGLAGLTASYLLKQTHKGQNVKFEVHLFEKAASLGMDSSSISVPIPEEKREWRIDVPMRSFQGGLYTQLIALYTRLGVSFRVADFSYSFSRLAPTTEARKRRITTTMIYNGASGRAGASMPSEMTANIDGKLPSYTRASMQACAFGSFVLSTLQLLICYLHLLFFTLPIPFIRPQNLPSMSFRQWSEWAEPRGILARWTGGDVKWREFTVAVLLPLFSGVCTTSPLDIWDHPAEELLDYVWLTLFTHHYVVIHGVRDVVNRLTEGVSDIHLSSPITAMFADPSDPSIISIHCTPTDGSPETTTHGFHHIIFATQGTRAVPILESYLASLTSTPSSSPQIITQTTSLLSCLNTFTYKPSIVVNHTDSTLLPDNPSDIRELNLVFTSPSCPSSTQPELDSAGLADRSTNCVDQSYVMATHIMTRPLSLPPSIPSLYQTTNPILSPRPETILSIANLERAVLSTESKLALPGLIVEEPRRLGKCAGQGRTKLGVLQGPRIWVCGAYVYPGIPLLEGCVVSARNVVEQGILAREGVAVTSEPW